MTRIKPSEARQAQRFALNKPETFEPVVPPRFPRREDTMRTMVDPTVDLDVMRAEDDGMIPVESHHPDMTEPITERIGEWIVEHKDTLDHPAQPYQVALYEALTRWAEAPPVGERVVSLMDDLNPDARGPGTRYGTVTGYDRDLHLPVITWDHPRVDVEACEPHEYEVVS